MSKLDRPLIEKYWKRIGGTIVFEYPMVHRTTISTLKNHPTKGVRNTS